MRVDRFAIRNLAADVQHNPVANGKAGADFNNVAPVTGNRHLMKVDLAVFADHRDVRAI